MIRAIDPAPEHSAAPVLDLQDGPVEPEGGVAMTDSRALWGRMLLAAGMMAWGMLLVSTPVTAADTSYRDEFGYAYYDLWWQQHRSDRQTALLLHIGVPEDPAWTRPGDAVMAARETAEEAAEADRLPDGLFDDADVATPLDDLRRREASIQAERNRTGRPRSQQAPEGMIYDYSPNQVEIALPAGIRKIDHGRFGMGLEFSGDSGISTRIVQPDGLSSMEGWFKIAELPRHPVCLLASSGDGGRLLLHPDGQLELSWLSLASGERESIRSEVALGVDEWAHVAAYALREKHIEWVFKRPSNYEIRIGLNGEVVASHVRPGVVPETFIHPGPFSIGANPEGGQIYRGLMDEIRVAGLRRHHRRDFIHQHIPEDGREIAFGPPQFVADTRIFHASFETPDLLVHPPGRPAIEWKPRGQARFADMQVPGVYGTGLLVDPALGFPRIPIEGLSAEAGTFELWFRPVNWDNQTDHGKIDWNDHLMSVARFMGRDRRSGRIVPYMEVKLARATVHGEIEWIHPGRWSHFIWTWSADDVLAEDGWGSSKRGDPIATFRAVRFGDEVYRAMLTRDIALIDHIELLYLEIGITDAITVYHGQRPAIEVDEIIGHGHAFSAAERVAAPDRWRKAEAGP